MINNAIEIAATALATDRRWQAVQQVLASPTFAKAPRMCALLTFLMQKKLSGQEATISEHAIGIAVFRRDARDYDTAIDPVVRVQMGRLRERLAHYYGTAGSAGAPRIVIPAGSYVPELTPCEDVPRPAVPASLRLAPLRALTPGGTDVFVAGLEEELALQVFERFAGTAQGGADYRVDISVRVESRHVRASVRLVDAGTEQLVWLRQRDRRGELDIEFQEGLATDICDDLRDYLGRPGTQAASVFGAGPLPSWGSS